MSHADATLRPRSLRKWGLALGLFAVLYVPFSAKPVHIDDANFLMLAEGASRDPWRPHSILINWSGQTEPAFDILANPPGIAWYLAPVRQAPEWVLHLWMLPWLALAAWGCRQLGRAFLGTDGFVAAIYLLTCPVIVLAAHALTPDLPLFACITAGIGGFVTTRGVRWPFALLAGCAALFRYSGGVIIPLLMLEAWRRDRWRGVAVATLSIVPIAALALHDLHAYGQVHLFAMFLSQNDPQDRPFSMAVHNVVAGVAMLGGAVVLPVLVWRQEAVLGAVLGAGAGLNAAWFSGQNLAQAIPTVLCVAAGGAALALAFAPRVRDPLLSLWALGGAIFFFVVRFAATRYWAAFLPGVGLLALRNSQQKHRLLVVGIAANVVISLGIAIDDQNFARAQQHAARKVAQMGTGNFSGHWGWQHYLEKKGWTPLERGGEPAGLHARSLAATQQLPTGKACLELVTRFSMPDNYFGPRVRSIYGEAHYHSGVRGRYAPWTLSNEPYDVVSVYRRCDDATPVSSDESGR